MSDVKRLLSEATPLPWSVGEIRDESDSSGVGPDIGSAIVGPAGQAVVSAYNFHCCSFPIDVDVEKADVDLLLHAVNSLPDYEAAVDALDAYLDHLDSEYHGCMGWHAGQRCQFLQDVRAALARLREPVPA